MSFINPVDFSNLESTRNEEENHPQQEKTFLHRHRSHTFHNDFTTVIATPGSDRDHPNWAELARKAVKQVGCAPVNDTIVQSEALVVRAEQVCEKMEKFQNFWVEQEKRKNKKDQERWRRNFYYLLFLSGLMLTVTIFQFNTHTKIAKVEQFSLQTADAMSSIMEKTNDLNQGQCILDAKYEIVNDLKKRNNDERIQLHTDQEVQKLRKFYQDQQEKEKKKRFFGLF